jgi:hypothetical protein
MRHTFAYPLEWPNLFRIAFATIAKPIQTNRHCGIRFVSRSKASTITRILSTCQTLQIFGTIAPSLKTKNAKNPIDRKTTTCDPQDTMQNPFELAQDILYAGIPHDKIDPQNSLSELIKPTEFEQWLVWRAEAARDWQNN